MTKALDNYAIEAGAQQARRVYDTRGSTERDAHLFQEGVCVPIRREHLGDPSALYGRSSKQLIGEMIKRYFLTSEL
uniref:Uncharacterized protein n=1 Tax=Timema cristinae TaxID=61476 RepID=A0A7R9GR47_TIMCR|nr:unnamed protein product [Timema cristinae]